MNDYISKTDSTYLKEIETLNKKLLETHTQIKNIVNAVASGFTHGSFLARMEDLENSKALIEVRIKELELKKKNSHHRGLPPRAVLPIPLLCSCKNIPEIKKFINNYVEKVVVYTEHVDVLFNLVVCTEYGGEPWLDKSTIRRREMLRIFGEVT